MKQSSPSPARRDGASAQLVALDHLLAKHGLTDLRVRAEGPAAEIAVIEAPLAEAKRLADLAGQIRTLGFRYVAIDLGSTSVR